MIAEGSLLRFIKLLILSIGCYLAWARFASPSESLNSNIKISSWRRNWTRVIVYTGAEGFADLIFDIMIGFGHVGVEIGRVEMNGCEKWVISIVPLYSKSCCACKLSCGATCSLDSVKCFLCALPTEYEAYVSPRQSASQSGRLWQPRLAAPTIRPVVRYLTPSSLYRNSGSEVNWVWETIVA